MRRTAAFLSAGLLGVAALLGGLALDSYLHARDPGLAHREGLFTQQLHYAISKRGIEPRLRFSTDVIAGPRSPLKLEQMVQRIILGPVLATPLALRSVARMLEVYQPAWSERVRRSTTPYRSQR